MSDDSNTTDIYDLMCFVDKHYDDYLQGRPLTESLAKGFATYMAFQAVEKEKNHGRMAQVELTAIKESIHLVSDGSAFDKVCKLIEHNHILVEEILKVHNSANTLSEKWSSAIMMKNLISRLGIKQ